MTSYIAFGSNLGDRRMHIENAKKHFAEKCLLDQPFVKNPDQTVGEYVKEHIAKLGENIIVRRFARIQLGEKV